MTDDPQPPRRERNEFPAKEQTRTGRAFPMLAPLIIAVLALIIMLVFWLPQ